MNNRNQDFYIDDFEITKQEQMTVKIELVKF